MNLGTCSLLFGFPAIFTINAMEEWHPHGWLGQEWNWDSTVLRSSDANGVELDAFDEYLYPKDHNRFSHKSNIPEMNSNGFHASPESHFDFPEASGSTEGVLDALLAFARVYWKNQILDANLHTMRNTGEGDESATKQASETTQFSSASNSVPSENPTAKRPRLQLSPSNRLKNTHHEGTETDTWIAPRSSSKQPKANRRLTRVGQGSFREFGLNAAVLDAVFAKIQSGFLTSSFRSKGYYPEATTTTNVAQSIYVPRITFDIKLFDHVQDLEGNTHNLDKLLQMIKELPGGQMVVPPKRLKNFINVFSPTKQNASPTELKTPPEQNALPTELKTPPEQKASLTEVKTPPEVRERKDKKIRDAERYAFLKERKREFNENQDIWLIYFMVQTNRDFTFYLQKIKETNFAQVFPIFLFYVEMINSTIFRQEEPTQLEYNAELETACESFLKSMIHLKFAPLTSSETADEITFHQKNDLGEKEGQQRILWMFLELWMKNHHPEFWNKNLDQRRIGLNRTVKVFFNNIFCYTIKNLTDRYKNLRILP
ncbi:hypothetical protein PGT21_004997 [Puccinia graminis f. sp. tritici]|uniref:Uncharacterized protein n=1 Tax=Puccinia graminis f. sp. tritici TaxID=56615 RepID=A0A5B0MAT9_PUCGR|nr:hypothetical protein PGTUg99_031208 [Puccinia graminis f. sp. tritici]KAA1090553.1 hypothetical protein PGT21_004997 [Puccinia graminis f. sp. tritici]